MEIIGAITLGACSAGSIAILIFKGIIRRDEEKLVTDFQRNKHLTIKRIERELIQAVIEREDNQ